MQSKQRPNPQIARHAAEKLDEVNQARFRREKGIVPPGSADRKREVGGKQRSGKAFLL